jgi:ABC-type polysaccharide/polyol phosphate transport system ATPase subunit
MKAFETSIIEFSELDEFMDLPVKYYSSGMYGRLAFSIATMIEPEILLVDEIFSTGDAHFVKKGTARMMEMFKSSQIVMYVSHSLEQVHQLCNRVIVLQKGEIVSQGDPDQMIDFYLKTIVNS